MCSTIWARYTHRVALSNQRLLSVADQPLFPLEGLCPRQQEPHHDPLRRRVPASLSATCPAKKDRKLACDCNHSFTLAAAVSTRMNGDGPSCCTGWSNHAIN